jgi:dTDP-4-amino-4,6-dideoxygalactose transaminase
MHGDEQRFVQEAFDTNWVAPLGKNVDEFEKAAAAYIGVSHATALVSGTAAIHLAVKLAGVSRGDIVLCSDLTFAATVNPVAYEGGRQVFIDAEPDSWNMDPKALETALQQYDGSTPDRPRAKAVLLANLYGTPARMDDIMRLCEQHGVPLIEDAAESLSATYKYRQTGSFGKYGILSFNGNKIITTSGGGMLLSNDEAAIRKARFWATQARDSAPWYQHSEIGYNYRMSNIVAGIGRGQMLWLDEHRKLKKAIYVRYTRALAGLPLKMNPYLPESEPNFWLSCIAINPDAGVSPDDIRLKLEEHNIECRPLWKPMHLQPLYAGFDFIRAGGEDVGGGLFARGLCLPSDIKMTEEEQERVVGIIKSCF